MIPRKGVFLRRLALIQTPRTLIDYEFLGSKLAVHSIYIPATYLYPSPMEDSAYVTRLLFKEAGYMSFILLLPGLKEQRHQIY